jgi:hypothetical protein
MWHQVIVVRPAQRRKAIGDTVRHMDGTDELTFTDEELAEQALAADPDAGVGDDAVPFPVARGEFGDLLPDWYMPAPAGAGDPALRGRRKVVSSVIIGSLFLVNAMGLCITDGSLEIPFF